MKFLDNINNTNEQTYKVPFIIPHYIISLILPKCNLVYGEVLSSVYLQVALNINYQKNIHNWKQNKSWIRPEKIATNTKYNIRKVNEALKILKSLHLIDIQEQKNKKQKYNLMNNRLHTIEEIKNFNNFIESQLLKGKNKTKTQELITAFNTLNTTLNFPKNKYIGKNINFKDINILRIWLNESSEVYKGSTLFFLTNIAMTAFECTEKDGLLLNLSQYERAIRLGTKQPTISRYVKSYIESGYLVVIENEVNKPLVLGLDPGFINKNLKKVVTNTMVNKIVCPLCNKEFYENRSLSVHISKTKDSKHILLNHMKMQRPNMDFINIYNELKEEFDRLDDIDMGHEENKVKLQPKTYDYLNIPCDCKMTCKECHKNWKLDYYNDCTHDRKMAFIKECGIEEEDKKLIKVASKSNTIEVTKEDFDVIKPTKAKKISTGTNAPDLVKYFYSQINGTSPNFGKECGQVKNLLKKYSADEIRTTMDYLKQRANTDLRFLNNSVPDALAIQKYLQDATVEGTEAYLVKMFYDGFGQPINVSSLVSDIRKVKEVMNSGRTYEQVKQGVQYMVEIKCAIFNYLAHKVTEAIMKGGNVVTMQKNIQNNPAYFNRDNSEIIKSQLLDGKPIIKKLDDTLRNEALKMARELFAKGEFTDKFGHFEWAWRIGLDLDYEMYQIAKHTESKALVLDSVLSDPRLPEESRQKVINAKDSYQKWLKNQKMKFESAQSN